MRLVSEVPRAGIRSIEEEETEVWKPGTYAYFNEETGRRRAAIVDRIGCSVLHRNQIPRQRLGVGQLAVGSCRVLMMPSTPCWVTIVLKLPL